VWLAIARLGDLGILSAKTTTDAAILAGGVGAAFALLGFFLSAGRSRPTTATGTAAESPGSRRNDAPHGGATTVESTAVPQPAGGGSETSPGAAPQPAVPRTSRPRSTKAG